MTNSWYIRKILCFKNTFKKWLCRLLFSMKFFPKIWRCKSKFTFFKLRGVLSLANSVDLDVPSSFNVYANVLHIWFWRCIWKVTGGKMARTGQTTPQMFRQFLGISHYFALPKKYWLSLHQTWRMSRRPTANYIYLKNVNKSQSCDVTVMTSCFLPLLKFLTCIFFTMCSKEHIKGSWNLKKFCQYHKYLMKYGIFKYEK